MLTLLLLLHLDSVSHYITQHPHIKYKHLTVAQAVHESGRGTSRLYRKHHNAFGFVTGSFQDYRAGKWAGYYSYRSTVDQFAKWQHRVITQHRLNSLYKYKQWIKNNYAADPRYLLKLNRYVHR